MIDSTVNQSAPSQSELDFGTRLRFIREQNGLSQRELAKRAGVPHSSISMIEQGQSSPSVNSLTRILGGIPMSLAQFFSCDLTQLPPHFYHAGELLERQITKDGITTLPLPLMSRFATTHFTHVTYAPSADTGELPQRSTQALSGFVVQGRLELTLNAEVSPLGAGDVFCLRELQHYRLRNPSLTAACVVLICSAD